LAQRTLVPELIQEAATAERLAEAVQSQLDDKRGSARLVAQFREIHLRLRQGAARRAAAAVLEMLRTRGGAGEEYEK
jgi:lipid-A-disaccharide synthase